MYCRYCGKSLSDNNAFCTHCGKPTGIQQDDLAYWVALAREGNQQAVSTLYEKTYSKVFYTIKSMIKDEDAVLDILQDTYIKAFMHLDTFEGNEKFLPWVKQIAKNAARDWLKKKKPTLFTEMSLSEEQDTPAEELFADERSAYIPEQVIDQNETKRLIREIIDDLPDDQRAVIGMYYYEEMSVKEIAEAMESTESAVKSRLMYGRKKIEKKVRELEKRGTKLYGLSPIPFLLLLFHNQDASASELANGQILQRVLENTPNIGKAASSAAGTSAGTQAGTTVAGTLGTAKVVLISIIAAVVIGAGIFGVTRLVSDSNNQTDNAVTEAVVETVEPTAEPSSVDDALKQYRTIISNAPSYQYDPYGSVDASGKYRYALVQMYSDDTVPTLLLEQETTDHMYYMRAFKYDPDTKTVHQPTDSLMEGVAKTGGYRGSIDMAGDGRGIIMMEGSSRGSATIYRVTLEGDSLIQTKEWEGNIFESSDNIPTVAIEWHDIGDLSALDGWTPSPATAADTQATAVPTALPTDGNRIVLTGTVGTYSYDGVLALQGISDPNPGYSSTKNAPIRLIVLDTPQTLSLRGEEEFRSGYVTIIDVSYTDSLTQYEGQHIT
ncbi:MAG: sigma-70 family RNA polymerase sigma factor, partial [Hominilimicola sp.]